MTFKLTFRTPDELQADATAAAMARLVALIDDHVESQARTLGYNSAAHIAGYAASTVPDWATEAQAFIAWRDQVWQAVFALQSQHLAAKTMPSLDDVTAVLPAWKGH